jgi:hypothetical protein
MAVTLENATLGGRPTEEATGVHIEDEIRSFCIIGDDSPTLFSPGTLLLTFRRDDESDEEHDLAVSLHGPRGVGRLCAAKITFAPASADPSDALRQRTMLRFPEPFGFSVAGEYVFRAFIDGQEVGVLNVPATVAHGVLRVVFSGLFENPPQEQEPNGEESLAPARRLSAELPFTLYCGDAFGGYRIARLWLRDDLESDETPYELEVWPPSPRLVAAPGFVAAVHAAHDRYLIGRREDPELSDGRSHELIVNVRVEETFDLPEHGVQVLAW